MSPYRPPTARAWSSYCRYLLRPPVAQDRLRRLGDDRILLTLKTAWADGTRHLIFAPMELLEKLAALTPRPRINLILYHGVLAPHARWRARIVAHGPLAGAAPMPPSPEDDARAHVPSLKPRHRGPMMNPSAHCAPWRTDKAFSTYPVDSASYNPR